MRSYTQAEFSGTELIRCILEQVDVVVDYPEKRVEIEKKLAAYVDARIEVALRNLSININAQVTGTGVSGTVDNGITYK